MKKIKPKQPASPITGTRIPSPDPAPKSAPTPETAEQRQARVEAANKAIKGVCEQYHCSFHVPHLDISSGKIMPVITVIALDLPA